MKSYLTHSFSPDDPDLISVIDELPLWAAPFGMKLFEFIEIKTNIMALDVGCGLGFPLLELAQRLGRSSKVYGIDPWEAVLGRVGHKLKVYSIQNVEIVLGKAESMPFEDHSFDLITSNNGITNVSDLPLSLAECYRVARPDSQFVMSYNLEETMIEFYTIFEAVLTEEGLPDSVEKLREHIIEKRKPLSHMKKLLSSTRFKIKEIDLDTFRLDFADAESLFHHSLIKYWFLPSWKKLVPGNRLEEVFSKIEHKLNDTVKRSGKISLTVPYATINAIRK